MSDIEDLKRFAQAAKDALANFGVSCEDLLASFEAASEKSAASDFGWCSRGNLKVQNLDSVFPRIIWNPPGFSTNDSCVRILARWTFERTNGWSLSFHGDQVFWSGIDDTDFMALAKLGTEWLNKHRRP